MILREFEKNIAAHAVRSQKAEKARKSGHEYVPADVSVLCIICKKHDLPRQPSATSSAIMTVKPAAKNKVPRFECSPSDISGISSSTTTYIIAPAAKLRK